MKILYILVSAESDFYYEQALISMMSAKYQMPNCSISLLTERDTDNNLKDSRNLINEYLDEKVVIDLDPSLSPMQKSRWLKTSMRALIKDDFLFVDVDTVFAAPIDESLFTHDVMGVPDGNSLLKDHPLKWQIVDVLKKLRIDNHLDYHINSGVLFCKDSLEAQLFFETWHRYWNESRKKGLFIDQPALHKTISERKGLFEILPNYYNAQFGRNVNMLSNGVILHYYSSQMSETTFSPAYKFLQQDFLKSFRDNPKSPVIQYLIQQPKEAFDNNSLIMSSKIIGFGDSHLVHHLISLWTSPDRADMRLFRILEKIVLKGSVVYYIIIKLLHPIYKLIAKS